MSSGITTEKPGQRGSLHSPCSSPHAALAVTTDSVLTAQWTLSTGALNTADTLLQVILCHSPRPLAPSSPTWPCCLASPCPLGVAQTLLEPSVFTRPEFLAEPCCSESPASSSTHSRPRDSVTQSPTSVLD